MKIALEQSNSSQPEIIIRCADAKSDEVTAIVKFLESMGNQRLIVVKDGQQTVIGHESVIYLEYIERKVFAYTKEDVFTTKQSLSEIETQSDSFFRCSKNTVVNIKEIYTLKSAIGGNILATLSTGEKILISRHYASKLRKLIKER